MRATDSGAIYIFDRSHSGVGNQITNNLIRNVGSGSSSNATKAIYLDDLTSNVLVSGNICQSCGTWAWSIHAGDHNTIVDNIFDISSSTGNPLGLYQTMNSGYNIPDYGMTGNVFQRNIVYFDGPAPSNLYQVNILSSDALPATSGNLFYSAAGTSVRNGEIIIDSNPVFASPLFARPSAGDYSMPSNSPAFTSIGFQALPTDQGPSGGPQAGGGSGSGPNPRRKAFIPSGTTAAVWYWTIQPGLPPASGHSVSAKQSIIRESKMGCYF